MKKIKYLTIIVLLLLIVTGCKNKEQKQVAGASKNTSISEKGLKSYRAKVSISGKDITENYIVLNKNNKTYNITVSKDNEQIYINIEDGNTVVTTENGEIYSKEIKYDYTNTDLFLVGLDTTDKDIKTKDIEISGEKYTEYDFKVTSETFNKIMEPFDVSVSEDGEGYAYVTQDGYVFLINYNVGGIHVNVTYTRLNEVK